MSIENAVARMEARLAQDPRIEQVGPEQGPRELLFTRSMIGWIKKLSPQASDALLVAAWGHVLNRWTLPRDSHPKTTAGYHKWRKALDVISADATERILRGEAVDDETIARVRELILKKKFPADPESRILEDASCLAFLELKIENYLPEWDEPKAIRILVGTLEKMSPEARVLAKTLSYSPEAQRLLEIALSGLGTKT